MQYKDQTHPATVYFSMDNKMHHIEEKTMEYTLQKKERK